MLCPWALAMAVIAHHRHDHMQAAHADDEHDAIAVALHGHHHEAGTAHHQHLFRVACASALPTKLLLALTLVSFDRVVDGVFSPIRRTPSASRIGHSPPAPALVSFVLRI